uniref:Serine/threonine-protein phosphatase 2A 55 kDa regulatory subunit B beta isoform n=1 Tax=Scleropages formosus TaxID=113540 RepID=A0A8C9VKY6_SCLFO
MARWFHLSSFSANKLNGLSCVFLFLADIISTVEFNATGELLATGDKGGRVVVFQREQESKNQPHRRGEYNVYSTFQSHEPEFDYLKSLEIEEKINKIRWLPQQNAAYFLLSTNDVWAENTTWSSLEVALDKSAF